MFYLREDVPLVNGHAIYIDSEWALTSISQRQFWRGVDFAGRRRQRRRDPVGRRLRLERAGPAARASRRAVHAARRSSTEVWAQLHDHLEERSTACDVRVWFLDPAIEFPNPTGAANLEPLLVNTAGSWADRPDAVDARSRTCSWPPTTCARTRTWRRWRAPTRRRGARSTGSSTRRGSRAPRCEVWPLREPRGVRPREGARPRPLAAAPPGAGRRCGWPRTAAWSRPAGWPRGLRAPRPAAQASTRLSPRERAAALELARARTPRPARARRRP